MEYNFIDGASKFDLDYVLDKPKSAKAYFTYLLARCLRMFEYKNLPDTIPADIFDRYVMMNGVACVGKDQNDDLRVFFGNWGGEYDVYYRPSLFIVSNPHIEGGEKEGWFHQYTVFPRSKSTKQDGVLMRNDTAWFGLSPMLSRYSALFAENILTIRTADVMLRIIALLSAPSDEEFASAMEYIKALENGKLKAVGDNPFFEGIKLQSPPSNNGSYLTQFIELHQYLKGSFYNEIGLSANYNMKREAIGKGESTLDNDSLLPLCENMLLCRREDWRKVNELFGTEVEVDFSSSWKENQVQRNIELLSQLEEVGNSGAVNVGANPFGVGESGVNTDGLENNSGDSIGDEHVNVDSGAVTAGNDSVGGSDVSDNGQDVGRDRIETDGDSETTDEEILVDLEDKENVNDETVVDMTLEKIDDITENMIDDKVVESGKESEDDTGTDRETDETGTSEDSDSDTED